jgi:putative tricarboxylic transport membrane protein
LINVDALVDAVYLVFSLKTIFWLVAGVTLGVAVGAIPGLTTVSGIALMLPLTFTLDTTSALAILIGLYKGAVYGGSISAISFATPGTPEAGATIFDGFKMMQRGKGRKAMLMALYASVTSDFLSDLIVVVVAPLLAIVALKFGPSERFWLMALAVTLLGSLSGRHFAKGMLSAALGVFVGTIGVDPVGGVSRNTFGIWWLQGGFHLVPMVIGIFAMARMFEEAVTLLKEGRTAHRIGASIASLLKTSSEGLTFREYARCWKEMAIGLGIGSFVGMLPGLGATVGAFLSFSVAKQVFPRKRIGTGVIEGVAAAESGNNATVGPTLIPLLAFGIPGSGAAALIGGALMLQGVAPSPRMFDLFPTVVYSLFILLLIGNLANLGIGRIFAFVYAKLGELPKPVLVPLIMVMAIIGSYAFEESIYDVILMLAFGFIGFGMRKFGVPEAPMVITFLITPMMEGTFRRALLIHQGDVFGALFNSPLAVGLCVAAIVLSWAAVRTRVYDRIDRVAEEGAARVRAEDE